MSGLDYDVVRDRYAEELDRAVRFTGLGHEFFTRAKASELLELARRRLGDTAELDALDVGCGIGLAHRFLGPRFGSLTGVDVSPGVLEHARGANPSVRYELSAGERLPFEPRSFDLSFSMGVVQVLPPPQRVEFLAELARVTRPDGVVAIFEHNPLNPLTRLVVRRCEFGSDAEMLRAGQLVRLFREAGLEVVERRFILLFPSRRRRLLALERRLRHFPIGAQYYVAGAPSR